MGTEKRERQKSNRALKQQEVQQAVTRRKLYKKIAIGAAGLVAIILFVWIASNFVGESSPSTPNDTVPSPTATIDSLPTGSPSSVPVTTAGG